MKVHPIYIIYSTYLVLFMILLMSLFIPTSDLQLFHSHLMSDIKMFIELLSTDVFYKQMISLSLLSTWVCFVVKQLNVLSLLIIYIHFTRNQLINYMCIYLTKLPSCSTNQVTNLNSNLVSMTGHEF